MIGYLRGEILEVTQGKGSVTLPKVIVFVGGVGYLVEVLPKELPKLGVGSEVNLYIYTHSNERDLKLYGFLKKEELAEFREFLKAPRVGPRNAMIKLEKQSDASTSFVDPPYKTIVDHLISLGYSEGQAREVASKVSSELPEDRQLKEALRLLRLM